MEACGYSFYVMVFNVYKSIYESSNIAHSPATLNDHDHTLALFKKKPVICKAVCYLYVWYTYTSKEVLLAVEKTLNRKMTIYTKNIHGSIYKFKRHEYY